MNDNNVEEDQSWRSSPDAMVWATKFAEYLETYGLDPKDPGTMVVWFANAMAASDRHAAKERAEVYESSEGFGDLDHAVLAQNVPVVVYKDGKKYVVGHAEIRDTADGLNATVELNEVLSAAPASPTSVDMGFVGPVLRANPYDPAIFGPGASQDGLKIINEIDRNARAYGWEIGQGRQLTTFMPAINPKNPFLQSDWRDPLYKDLPDCADIECGFHYEHKHGVACHRTCTVCQGY